MIQDFALNYIFKNSAHNLFTHRNSCSHRVIVSKLEEVPHTLSFVDVGV